MFPELTLTGFSMNKDLSEPPDGDSVNQFMRLSEKIGIAAGFGFACRTGEGITNRFCIVNAGRVVANYDKIHPFPMVENAQRIPEEISRQVWSCSVRL